MSYPSDKCRTILQQVTSISMYLYHVCNKGMPCRTELLRPMQLNQPAGAKELAQGAAALYHNTILVLGSWYLLGAV